MRRFVPEMEGGIVSAVPEPPAPEVAPTNGRRRMARLNEEEVERLIEKMKLPRPVLPVVLPDGFLRRDPKKREEWLALRTSLVGEMQQLWDYNKRLLDHYHEHGYVEVLVDDENMWELY